MQLITTNFQNNEEAWTLKTLEKKTKISQPALMVIISALIENNLITITGKKNQQFLPSQSLENISIKTILAAVRSAEEAPQLRPDDIDTAQQVEEVILSLESAITDSTRDKTLRDLV